MFNISFSELLFIFILAFIVLGPEKLPRTFYSLGIIVRKIKHEYEKLQKEINKNINDQMVSDYNAHTQQDFAPTSLDPTIKESTDKSTGSAKPDKVSESYDNV